MRGVLVLAATGLATACGVPGGAGGGADNLPTLGAGPYGKLEPDFDTPADEPFLVADAAADLSDPAGLWLDGGFSVYYTRQAPGGAAEIWRADLSSEHQLPDPAPARVALDGGEARAPSAVDAGGWRVVLFYQTGESVARADSDDGGASFSARGVVLEDAVEPSALLVDGEWLLYHGRPGRDGIWLARSADGLAFERAPAAVLESRPAVADAFDAAGVGAPAAVGGRDAAGQVRIGLFYAGRDAEGGSAIGYAGSDDGETFLRFGGGEPVLEPGLADERAPAALLRPSRGLLMFDQKKVGRWAVAVATCP